MKMIPWTHSIKGTKKNINERDNADIDRDKYHTDDIQLFTEACVEELFDRVGVPLFDGQRFHDSTLFVHELDDGVGSTDVTHSQPGELLRAIALHERLYLWEPTQFSATYFKVSEWE